MNKHNEELAKVIDTKPEAAGLIGDTEAQLACKLAKGTLRIGKWNY